MRDNGTCSLPKGTCPYSHDPAKIKAAKAEKEAKGGGKGKDGKKGGKEGRGKKNRCRDFQNGNCTR
eukprot:13169484-Heterocapsa_arctica.AAC.1